MARNAIVVWRQGRPGLLVQVLETGTVGFLKRSRLNGGRLQVITGDGHRAKAAFTDSKYSYTNMIILRLYISFITVPCCLFLSGVPRL